MASFSVRVVDDDQEPISGARVVLGFTSILRGMTAEEYTDSDGYAYFDGYDEGEVEVLSEVPAMGHIPTETAAALPSPYREELCQKDQGQTLKVESKSL